MRRKNNLVMRLSKWHGLDRLGNEDELAMAGEAQFSIHTGKNGDYFLLVPGSKVPVDLGGDQDMAYYLLNEVQDSFASKLAATAEEMRQHAIELVKRVQANGGAFFPGREKKEAPPKVVEEIDWRDN